ncbi:DUF4214 domain-containing protein [Acetobacter sp.]|uniref:DUF4214 domain-containing protein n=1 Tax=Acetobacter sp. TaxID=440 RepID=UPI0039E913E5
MERERIAIQRRTTPNLLKTQTGGHRKNRQSNRQNPEITGQAHQSGVLRSLHIAFSDAAAAKVNDLYAQVLGRGSDPGGLKAQQNALSSGMTLHDVRWSMAHSAEEVRSR